MIEKLISSDKNLKLNIVVIGDIAIDSYHYGKISRICPEFPVAVLNSPDMKGNNFPGMAANVCYQMKHFNANVFLLGLMDKNTACALNNYEFNTNYCVSLIDGKNPLKNRLYDGNHPLLRWDIEQPNYGESNENLSFLRESLLLNFYKIVDENKINIVVLSDYNKGLFSFDFSQKVIDFCNNQKITTIVDPKKPPLAKWKSCTYLKPNSFEVKDLTFDGPLEEQMKKISTELDCKGVIVTQEGKGFTCMLDDNLLEYKADNVLPLEKVNSTIGSGDAFLSMLAVCLGHDIDFLESCKLAFAVGTKYVQEKHNKPVSINDLKSYFNFSKIIDDIDFLKSRDYTLVFTNGCFDFGLTMAHIECLTFAKKQGEKLIVAINMDESVNRLKGKGRPIMPFLERASIVSALECVDFVVGFNEDTPARLIEELLPSIIVKGGDYKKQDVVGNKLAEVKIFDFVKVDSTTEKIAKFLNLPQIHS